MSTNLFFLAIIVTASGLVSPPLALLAGLVYGFCLAHPFPAESKRLAKFLLQVSVVALGFGMNLHDILQAGRSGFLYTAASIAVAMSLGLALGSLLRVDKKPALLISAGTAIAEGAPLRPSVLSRRLMRNKWQYRWVLSSFSSPWPYFSFP